MTISVRLVDQVIKQTFQTLIECKANFNYTQSTRTFGISQARQIRYDQDTTSGRQLCVTFEVLNNPTTNMICFALDNVTYHYTSE